LDVLINDPRWESLILTAGETGKMGTPDTTLVPAVARAAGRQARRTRSLASVTPLEPAGPEQLADSPASAQLTKVLRKLRRELRRSEARLTALLSSTGDLVFELDGNGAYLEIWTSEDSLLAAPKEELRGRTVIDVVGKRTGPGLLEAIRTTYLTGEPCVYEYSLRVPAGLHRFQAHTARVRSPGHRPTVCMRVRDITVQHTAETARQTAEAQLLRQAMYDSLTGLPNRYLFSDRLNEALKAHRRSHASFALLVLDIDHFKEVNDALGHHAGDEVLKELAARLVRTVRNTDSVARLGGDEFAILVPGATETSAEFVASRLANELEEPVAVEGLSLNVDVSVGSVMFPRDGESADKLLRRADVAMYAAKGSGRGFARYDAGSDQNHPEALLLLGELRGAVDRGEFVLHYQPQLVLSTGKVESMEALIRWQHPTRGLLSPDQFIPLVQETSLIKPLTLFVIEEALKQCKRLSDSGYRVRVGVNLAMRNLIDQRLPDEIAALLDRYALPPESLELEITESSVMKEPRRSELVLSRLAAIGCRLAVDDFGTGYASLAYLTRLPVQEVKIDSSFVIGMDEDAEKRQVVRSTIELVSSLGKEVVAEGVESMDVLRQLMEYGCHIAQGFCISKPLPAAQLETWIARHSADVRTHPSD
jgi:diguanylate cyclase (GGDEF)-like protein/PAS domain S-box-containing protein